MIQTLLIGAIVIAWLAWYAQHRWRRRARRLAAQRRRIGLDVLDRRYATGEIDRVEYLQKKEDILSVPGNSGGWR